MELVCDICLKPAKAFLMDRWFCFYSKADHLLPYVYLDRICQSCYGKGCEVQTLASYRDGQDDTLMAIANAIRDYACNNCKDKETFEEGCACGAGKIRDLIAQHVRQDYIYTYRAMADIEVNKDNG